MQGTVTALSLGLFVMAQTVSATPWASSVISYDQGMYPQPGYTNATAALGPASTYTGEGPWAGPVTMFNAPYLADEVVSLGSNGSLVVRFDMPVTDQPGADFIVYGNAGFADPVWDDLTLDLGDPATMFGADGGRIAVSQDNVTWKPLVGTVDALFPTQPWRDPASTMAAAFGKPVPAGLTLSDFDGLSFADALALYDGSAGGAAFDLASTGWSEIQYIRISNDGLAGFGDLTTEIDAIRVVPEPGSLGLLALGTLGILRRRRP